MAETGTQTAIRFEREVCSRCMGSGQFSYCQMYGTTCFKCGGAGKVLTKRGIAAHQWMYAKLTIRFDEVKLGQRVKVSGLGKFNVKKLGFNGTVSKSKNFQTGEWIDHPAFEVSGETLGIIGSPENTLQVVLPAAEHNALLAEAIEFQNSLTQAGTVRKSKKIAV